MIKILITRNCLDFRFIQLWNKFLFHAIIITIINYLEEGVQSDFVARKPFPRILFQKGD